MTYSGTRNTYTQGLRVSKFFTEVKKIGTEYIKGKLGT